jgi:tRNA threonylcarbamoyladenosine biosynthesis protein TsaE
MPAVPDSTDPTVTLTIGTPDDMAELGALLAQQLRAGDLVTLNGELGAGKTTLTRGLGEALGVRGAVTSPTFVLARTHPRESGVGAPLVHVDAYRLSSAAELDDLDIDFARSIVVVEWGAGLLDGITDEWLSLDIVRPTGALVVDDAAPSDGVDADASDAAAPAADISVDEVIEPRTSDQVTDDLGVAAGVVFGEFGENTEVAVDDGERWKDLGWIGAASN